MMHTYTPNDLFHATISEIDDSDPPHATNFNTATEGLADNTKWLKLRTGTQRQIDGFLNYVNDDSEAVTLGTWTNSSLQPDVDAVIIHDFAPGVLFDDAVLDVQFSGHLLWTSAAGTGLASGLLRMYFKIAGAPTYSSPPGAATKIGHQIDTGNINLLKMPFTIRARFGIGDATTHTIIALAGAAPSGDSVAIKGTWRCDFGVYRPNT